MTALASAAQLSDPPIRLIRLPDAAEQRLAETLRQPQVSFIGLMADAPDAGSLIHFVRENIKPVEMHWTKEMLSGVYSPVRIKAVEGVVSSVKREKGKRKKKRPKGK
jgi:hypothetical protein